MKKCIFPDHTVGHHVRRPRKMYSGERRCLGARMDLETDVRLRVHGDLARIEVSPAVLPLVLDCRDEINAGLKRLGFKFLTLNLEWFRSGCYYTKQE